MSLCKENLWNHFGILEEGVRERIGVWREVEAGGESWAVTDQDSLCSPLFPGQKASIAAFFENNGS